MPAGLVASDTKTDFSQAVPHMSAGVALRFSTAPWGQWGEPGLRKEEAGSNRKKGFRRGRSHPPQLLPLPTALHSPLLARRGPTGKGTGASPAALQLGTPKPIPKLYQRFYLLILLPRVPARPPKTKVPSSPGVLAPASHFLPSHPWTPDGERTSRV